MAGKVETYLGFCIKARKLVTGSGSIDALRRGVHLIMVCSSASENTFKVAHKFKNRFCCPLVICRCGLENAVNKAGCKLAAVMDASLAGAIVQNCGDDYELYTER